MEQLISGHFPLQRRDARTFKGECRSSARSSIPDLNGILWHWIPSSRINSSRPRPGGPGSGDFLCPPNLGEGAFSDPQPSLVELPGHGPQG